MKYIILTTTYIGNNSDGWVYTRVHNIFLFPNLKETADECNRKKLLLKRTSETNVIGRAYRQWCETNTSPFNNSLLPAAKSGKSHSNAIERHTVVVVTRTTMFVTHMRYWHLRRNISSQEAANTLNCLRNDPKLR